MIQTKYTIMADDLDIYFKWSRNLLRRIIHGEGYEREHWLMCRSGMSQSSVDLPDFYATLPESTVEAISLMTDPEFTFESSLVEQMHDWFGRLLSMSEDLSKRYGLTSITSSGS